ncbi:DUF4304 domain-containing protein [Cupriavidus sp. 2SB]|uniref:DUF4304 domain-containing protein n=1 Tax=Cupriavidus sp. 2SB TaxID=2502199 RepID=UPI0010F90048|nr:DUF4304 domain-containing protein [Cupriavidus sp. 2SB]
MMDSKKPFSTSGAFGNAAKKAGFNGAGNTRFIEYSSYWVIINRQKSAYGKQFYVNVGILFKELLEYPLSVGNIGMVLKMKSSIEPHARWRIERSPGMPSDIVERINRSIEGEQMNELELALFETFSSLLAFLSQNHNRSTIRKLHSEGQLPAILLKEV